MIVREPCVFAFIRGAGEIKQILAGKSFGLFIFPQNQMSYFGMDGNYPIRSGFGLHSAFERPVFQIRIFKLKRPEFLRTPPGVALYEYRVDELFVVRVIPKQFHLFVRKSDMAFLNRRYFFDDFAGKAETPRVIAVYEFIFHSVIES
jgi:hypothetical protein